MNRKNYRRKHSWLNVLQEQTIYLHLVSRVRIDISCSWYVFMACRLLIKPKEISTFIFTCVRVRNCTFLSQNILISYDHQNELWLLLLTALTCLPLLCRRNLFCMRDELKFLNVFWINFSLQNFKSSWIIYIPDNVIKLRSSCSE
jgi:hypothetical protein